MEYNPVMKSILPRLVLGAASWGNSYGIVNDAALGDDDATTLLSAASLLGVRGIDTAAIYGDSERLIGTVSHHGIPVFSKPPTDGLTPETLKLQVGKSLRRLGLDHLEGLTLHSSKQLLENPEGFETALESLLSDGLIKSWGASVYDLDEALLVANSPSLSYVQAPASIFDHRFLDSRFIGRLRDAGVGIQFRSIFLQGILLHEVEKLPKSLAALGPALKDFDLFCRNIGSSREAVAIAFVATSAANADLVVGVNSVAHLQVLSTLEVAELEPQIAAFRFGDVPRKLTDPRLWGT